MRRGPEGWNRTGWKTAYRDIGERLKAIKSRHGADAIALYMGNPSAMSAVTMHVASSFLRSLGSSRQYSSMSLDNMNKFLVAEEMFGDKSFILQRDWENARYMLVLGHNPRVSIFGHLSTRPRGLEEVRASQARGGHLVLVDPRRTESAAMADQHLRIRPGTDVFFLLALLNTVIAENLYERDFVRRYCERFDVLRGAVEGFTADAAEAPTGISAHTIRQIARDFAAADGAFALGNTGVSQQRYATVNEWAIEALNAITGNIDRHGGIFYNPGVVDEPRPKRTIDWDRVSRVGGYPRVNGEYPATTLAEEILLPGKGQIRALIVTAGNPLATGTDLTRLREAFGSLELLVVIDIFPTVTSQFAHWLLPATMFFERKDINITFTRHMPFPFVQYTESIVDPAGEALDEWDIFRGLHEAVGTPFLNRSVPSATPAPEGRNGYDVEAFFEKFLRTRGLVQLAEVKAHPHGLKLGDKPIGAFRALLERRAKKIDLAPESIVRVVPTPGQIPARTSADYPILLISRRNLHSMCSWLHTGSDAQHGNELEMHPEDAKELEVTEGGAVKVRSRTGEITAKVRITDAVSQGVISMQFGADTLGRSGARTNQTTMNVLVDANSGCDELTGMPTLNGIPVHVEPVCRGADKSPRAEREAVNIGIK